MFNLNDFNLNAASGRTSNYTALYKELRALKAGEHVIVTKDNGYNEARTFKHNKTNIGSCISKNGDLENYSFRICPPNDEAIKAMAIICEKSPNE